MKKKINILIILLVVISFLGINHSMNIQIKLLESEIRELEEQKENLLKQKQLYVEVLELQKELEENMNQQIGQLEIENEQLRTIRAKLTAYSPLDNQDGQQAEGNPNRTSIGKQVSRGIVATDPKKLPYGTKLEIPDWGVVEVGDTGGALRSDNKNIRIDLFMNTYKEAMSFGVQDKEVKILEWGGD